MQHSPYRPALVTWPPSSTPGACTTHCPLGFSRKSPCPVQDPPPYLIISLFPYHSFLHTSSLARFMAAKRIYYIILIDNMEQIWLLEISLTDEFAIYVRVHWCLTNNQHTAVAR